jgi:hypothetical protein
MGFLGISRRVVGISHSVVHGFLRLVSLILIFLAALFLFLRLYGVPDSLLRLVVRRMNRAGIAVDIEALTLTLRGWRVEGLRYYSDHPDDLSPLIQVDRLFVSLWDRGADGQRNVDLFAETIHLLPSVHWGISIPEGHPSLTVDRLKSRVVFRGKGQGIGIEGAAIDWLNLHIRVDGAIRNLPKWVTEGGALVAEQDRVRSVECSRLLSAKLFQQIEQGLTMIQFSESGIGASVQFDVDMGALDQSTLTVSLETEQVQVKELPFSRVDMQLTYASPEIKVERLVVEHAGQSLQGSASYQLTNHWVQCTLLNSITSNRLLALLPDAVHRLLEEQEVELTMLPWFKLNLGPAPLKKLHETLEGGFFIQQVGYQGMVADGVRGRVRNCASLFSIDELQGRVSANDLLKKRYVSCMEGGPFNGRVYWNHIERVFGVEADTWFDPLLLIPALSSVDIATNVLHRFSFPEEPPSIRLALGACVDNWRTFHLDIHGRGRAIAYEGVRTDRADVHAKYAEGVLTLDPLQIEKGGGRTDGEVVIDFRRECVTVSAGSSMHPADIEAMVWPESKIFQEYVQVDRVSSMRANGTICWGDMKQSDLKGVVVAEQVEAAGIALDRVDVAVSLKGERLELASTEVALYGGGATGLFSVVLSPAVEQLPYYLDATFHEIDFKTFQRQFLKYEAAEASGVMNGTVNLAADFQKLFWAGVAGDVTLSIDNGNLADLPFFREFSRLMRKVVPGFSAFTITHLRGSFALAGGQVTTEDLVFEGDIISAKGRGSFQPEKGLDAYVQVQLLRESALSRIVRPITDPFLRLLEMKVEGPFSQPTWRVDKFPREISDLFIWRGKEE